MWHLVLMYRMGRLGLLVADFLFLGGLLIKICFYAFLFGKKGVNLQNDFR